MDVSFSTRLNFNCSGCQEDLVTINTFTFVGDWLYITLLCDNKRCRKLNTFSWGLQAVIDKFEAKKRECQEGSN